MSFPLPLPLPLSLSLAVLLLLLTASLFASSVSASFSLPKPRPIDRNDRLFKQLADAGVLPHTAAPLDPWNTTSLKGFAYLPSTALNAIAMWRDYNPALVRKELGFARTASANVIRVPLHWVLWQVDAASLFANMDDFLQAANALGMRVLITVFDGLGNDPGADAVELLTSGAYKTVDYVANPGFSQTSNSSLLATLDAYTSALASRYGRDARVVGLDAFYRPNLCADQAGCPTYAFLERITNILHNAVKGGFVTITIIPGAQACDSKNIPCPGNRTVVAFENYNGNRGAVGGDTCGVQSCAASLAATPLPVILTGSMGRLETPPSAVCEILFEAYGQAFIDIPSHPPIGVVLPWLMIGADMFTRDRPVPNQGFVWPNGTWYDPTELACIAAPIPPIPRPPPGPPAPGVNFTTTDGLVVGLRNTTRAIQLLAIEGDDRWFGNFSFVPPLWNFIPEKPHRDAPGCNHVGDVTLRVQPASETDPSSWAFYSTSLGGDDYPAVPLPFDNEKGDIFDVSNLTDAATAPGQVDTRYPLGLHVVRSIERAPGGYPGFAIRWNISVPTGGVAMRVGGLGFSMISDTFFGGNNNTAIAAFGSFLEAHVGGAHGFATFTRADGSRTLVVTTCAGDPPSVAQASGMEAWRPLLEDASPPNEGIYEWTVHSAAWASEWAVNAQSPFTSFPTDPLHQKAWPHPQSPWPSWHLAETVSVRNPRPWNPPSSVVLQPGGPAAQYSLCFSLPPASPTLGGGSRVRDSGIAAAGRAVFTGVPGFVLTSDSASDALFVRVPKSTQLSAVSTDDPDVMRVGHFTPAAAGASVRVPVSGVPGARGRARVVLTFADGTTASVHYYILPPLMDLAALYGSFAASTSWFPRETLDSFGRSASFMPWDREDKVHVLQDARPFVVGLSDDAGAGANLGMASKLAGAPHAAQLQLLDEYVSDTLLGTKPDTATPPLFSLQDPNTWRILMTVWYFDKVPDNSTGYYQETDKCQIGPSWCAFNSPWCNPEWCALPPSASGWSPASYRQYNFPHQTAVYWSLYLAARNFDAIPLRQNATWYLNAAFQTLVAANCPRNDGSGILDCLVQVGLMDGTVWREVLRALDSEGAQWASQANLVREIMQNRTLGDPSSGWEGWNTMDNPAGSEFAWDTTGQEEVAVWGAYFNASDAGWMHGELNARTVDSILGYMGSVPTWAYHGAAVGFCDFSNNGKWMVTDGCEREGGHYRAGLNSIPVIERYRAHPDDFYLLQTGIAGIMAPLPNIDADGAPSMAFHTHPFIMEHDPNSGDHGLGFFGSSLNAGAYLHNHTDLGLLCFMCELSGGDAGSPTLSPRDTYHRRVFLEPIGLWMVAEAGIIANVTLMGFAAGSKEMSVSVVFEPSSVAAASAGTGGLAPYSALRLRLEQASPASRPYTFSLAAPSGAPFVRGAYEFAMNPDFGGVTEAKVVVVKESVVF